MAKEYFDSTFQALGALDVLTRGIKESFALWHRIKSSNQSIQEFKFLLDRQEGRFHYWALEWEVEQNLHVGVGKMGIHQAQIAVPYLQQIQQITRELSDGLDAILPNLGENQSLEIAEPAASQLASSSVMLHTSDNPGTISTTPREKVNWISQEKKFNDRMILLRSLLNELYACFPIPNKDPAGHIPYIRSLRSQDPITLAHVGDVVDDPLEQGLAFSRSLVHMPPSARTSVLRLDRSKLVETSPGDGKSRRFVGTYNGRPVLVERKSSRVPKTAISQSDILNARIENIVMRLQHEKKPDQLRTLSCCGVIKEYSSAGTAGEVFVTDYNIVYKIDTPNFFSLRRLLSQGNSSKTGSKEQKIRGPKTGIPLGRRFIIAQTLASALMCLHLADWLHKAIRSDNILFFAESMAEAGFTLPYLVGFEYSRPDAPAERTEDIVDGDEYIYYRHPDAHFVPVAGLQQPLGGAGRYSKVYDIYSLGIILIELGLFKSTRSIVRGYTGSKAEVSGESIRKVLLDEGIADLKFHMGEVYANAARVCLDGFFDKFDKDDLPLAFSKHVVRPLRHCQA